MRLKPIVTALCAGALLAASPFASAKELKAIGVTVGDLANPFFVQITKGAELEARKLVEQSAEAVSWLIFCERSTMMCPFPSTSDGEPKAAVSIG